MAVMMRPRLSLCVSSTTGALAVQDVYQSIALCSRLLGSNCMVKPLLALPRARTQEYVLFLAYVYLVLVSCFTT